MIVGKEELYEEAKESLSRIQNFDVAKLPRVEDLGTRLNRIPALLERTLSIKL